MTSVTTAKLGGAFLLENTAPEAIFTPEDFTAEHRAIARTTDEFWTRDIAPHVNAIHDQQHAVAAGILKKSAEAGLLGVVIPEEFGGMGMDLASMMIVAEGVARDGSYAAWHGAHAGIGTLPVPVNHASSPSTRNKLLAQMSARVSVNRLMFSASPVLLHTKTCRPSGDLMGFSRSCC